MRWIIALLPARRADRANGVVHCWVLALVGAAFAFPAPAGAQLGVGDLLQALLAPEPGCTREQVVGACTCGPLPCGVRVARYVPVALVETVRAPGDSLLASMATDPAAATASSGLSMTDNTAEAHVWMLPELPCVPCAPSSAALPLLAPAHAAVACDLGDALAGIAQAPGMAIATIGALTLAYASELDAPNWRTGCRDLLPGATPNLDPTRCAFTADGVGDPDCLGRWGPLRPRQMRDIGPTPVLYSAKTAVRAMSIAREQLGTFPYAVDTQGLLQQVYPQASACFAVGSLPLPAAPDNDRPVTLSSDGRYGWLYWRQTSCCVGAELPQCVRGIGR